MSSIESSIVPVFETLEDELDFWKEGYHQLDKELQALKNRVASCQSCSKSSEEENEFPPPAKRPRIDEEADDSMDPFKMLGEDELFEILSYLTGKELLKTMEVSTEWKDFIESQKLLMARAMDEVVVVPNLTKHSRRAVENLFDRNQPRRAYKHMKAPFAIHKCFKYFKQVQPIYHFASTLETLEIDSEGDYGESRDSNGGVYSCFNKDRYKIKRCKFQKLKMLKLKDLDFKKLKVHSFPVLTHLEISHNPNSDLSWEQATEELREILLKFPKLEYLIYNNDLNLDLSDNNFDEFESDEELDGVEFDIAEDPRRPNIKGVSIRKIDGIFIMEQQNSLQVLELDEIEFHNLPWLLRNLKVLKMLLIENISYGEDVEIDLGENHSIETLKILQEFNETNFEHGDARNTSWEILVDRFLRALPSLRELFLHESINAERVKFAASNMSNLRRLVYREITEEASQAYQEVQRNAFRYKNAAFELVAEPDHDFSEVEESFDEFR